MLALLRRGRAAALRPPVLLALALAAWGVGESFVLDGSWPLWGRIAFVLIVLLPVALMERLPWLVVVILGAGCAVESSADVLELSVSPLQGIIISGWIAGARVAAPGRSAAVLVVVTTGISLATPGLDALACGVTSGIGWAGARAVGGVRRRRADAEAVLAALAAGGPARRDAAVATERRRLARELDVAVLRAARAIEEDAREAAGLLDDDPVAARAALVRVAEQAGTATGQMHRALMVLGAEGDAPDPDGIEGAAAALAARGIPATVRGPGPGVARRDERSGEARRSSLAAARALEVVTAGPWHPARVDIRRGRRATIVRVRTRGRTGPNERIGLARIAERARLSGGDLRVRRWPGPAGGRRVAVVRLPSDGASPGARVGATAVAVGLVAGVLTAVDILTGGSVPVDPRGAPSATEIVLASVTTVGVVTAAWTRTPWALALLGAHGFLRAAIVGYVGLDVTTVPLIALAAYLGASWLRNRWERAVVLAVVTAGGSAVALTAWEGTGPTDIAVLVFTIAVPWAIGAAVRDAAADAERLAGLRWATARDDLHAAQAAVDDERRRVAADLHDLAGHGLALISVQAWGAVQALPADRDRARAAIGAVRRVVRSSVAELELLLGPREAPGRVPDVDALVAEASLAGVPVRLRALLDGRAAGAQAVLEGLAAPARTAVRRIVQEGLTNVLRHAGAVPTTVLVARTARTVEVVVTSGPGRTGAPGGGRGLAAMRGRVAALGGTLEAGETPDGGFRLAAVIPDARPDGTPACGSGGVGDDEAVASDGRATDDLDRGGSVVEPVQTDGCGDALDPTVGLPTCTWLGLVP